MKILAAAISIACLSSTAAETNFLRDVAPILNKGGCTSGPCHGSAKGKNGFKLSLRGYDPQFDYEALLYDLSGRRFNRADPGKSLMLAKPTQQVAHQGGLRFEADSRYYKTIYNWIAQGVPYGDPVRDSVDVLEVEPKDIFMDKPGLNATVKVMAKYKDGTTRDVTADANVESNIPDVAKVSDDGKVTGDRTGEATLLVRYQGKFTTVPVTVLNPKPGFTWKAVPQNNFVDELIDAKLKKLKIQAAGLADDATFLRRVSLDLTGQTPAPDAIRAFLADATPTKIKRQKVIEKLLASPAYVDHWTVKWGDLLQNSRKFLGEKGAFGFREWIRASLAANKPWDKMVHEMITSRGSSYENPAANFFRVTKEAKPAMEKTTQVFLGVRMVCAQCHDHPFEKWTQNQYYEMAAFLAPVGVRAGYEVGEDIVYDQRSDYEMKHPKDGHVVAPKFLIASNASVPIPNDQKRRDAYADWLTNKANPFFAKSTANRIWSYFFGRGIIDPVDDIRASNPPVNPALLDALTKDFTDHNFDLRQLMRVIVNSRAYQAGIETNEWNAVDLENFSHQFPRRLTAEQLMDSVAAATGSRPVLAEVPPDTTASQVPDPHVGKEGFLDVFGRPSRESPCECERRSDFSLPQALNLVNGRTISESVADPKGRVAKLILSGVDDKKIVEELYLSSLGRLPTAAESSNGTQYMAGNTGGGRAAKAQDLLWALVNSKAFLYNH
jgi:hypothetical protein